MRNGCTSSAYTRVIQKFPDLIDKEICAYLCYYSLRSKTQSDMAAKLTRLTHKIVIRLHLVAESYTICSSRSRRQVRTFLDTPSYFTPPKMRIIIRLNFTRRKMFDMYPRTSKADRRQKG